MPTAGVLAISGRPECNPQFANFPPVYISSIEVILKQNKGKIPRNLIIPNVRTCKVNKQYEDPKQQARLDLSSVLLNYRNIVWRRRKL